MRNFFRLDGRNPKGIEFSLIYNTLQNMILKAQFVPFFILAVCVRKGTGSLQGHPVTDYTLP